MTAINLFVQRSRASLVTDGALYDADGRVLHVGSKVVLHERFRIAIAISGRTDRDRLKELLGSSSSADEAVSRLPFIARQMRSEFAAQSSDLEDQGLNDFQLFAAWWHRRERRAAGAILSSNQAYFGPSYRPFSLCEVDQVSSPPVAPPADLRSFDARREGRALIEAQRRVPGPLGLHWIGGFAELTAVDREGVRQERLCSWPDQIGALIAA